MRKLGLLGSSALRTGAVLALAASAATPAFAEDAVAQGDTAAQGEQAIVVTGSRIRRPNLESTVPITSISGETVFQGGDPAGGTFAGLAVSGDGSRVFAGGGAPGVVYRTLNFGRTWAPVAALSSAYSSSSFSCLALSPDGARVVAALHRLLESDGF